jgi:large subunit ribosomal protein L24
MDVAVPGWMRQADDTDHRPIRSVEQPVSFTKVRLVYPLEDTETGTTRDVIVKELVHSKIWFDKFSGRRSWSRIIPGLNVTIPWPKNAPQERKDYAADTLRLEVETKTFMPTLLTPPMPGSVIDELRNKYSIFRTRHDPEYVAVKEAEQAAEEAKKMQAREMRTPLKEIHYRERAANRAKGKTQKLTPEMLERIGQLIARKRQMVLDAAGVSKVGATSEPVAA